ncbi:MAG: pyruvate formate-lyase, partial [Erysipelotrichaceae bacterium]|nr:pyruvate formate-lyase [Erysipelotrichaceae bacterium]
MNKLLSYVPATNECDFDRIARLQDKMYHRKATLCRERAEIYTEVFRETEGESMILRKAKAFKKTLENMTIYIEPDSLIVGNQASRNFAAPVFPEYSIDWIIEEMDEFALRSGDSFDVDEDTKERIRKIAPYWMGRTHKDEVLKNLPPVNRMAEKQSVLHRGGISMSGDGHIVPNNEFVLTHGYAGIKEIAAKHLENDADLTDEQKDYYRSVIIAMEGALTYIERFSRLAYETAQNTADEKRKNELQAISEMMGKLMQGPVDSFYRAVETIYLTHLLMMI